MRKRLLTTLMLLSFLAPQTILAQEGESEGSGATGQIKVLKRGQIAPYTGLLIDEPVIQKMLLVKKGYQQCAAERDEVVVELSKLQNDPPFNTRSFLWGMGAGAAILVAILAGVSYSK